MSSSSSELPSREIPGTYGLPFLGPLKDRLDYYYNQGQDEFFRARMEKYQSTVFRCNMPPGPFMASNPKVIVLLDAISFRILFDNSRVEKRDVLDGTFMPSLDFTGGYRTCAYLDPSEANHSKLKGFFLSQLAKLHNQFIPTFRSAIAELFINLEDELAAKKQADFNTLSDRLSFQFVFKLFTDKNINPEDTPLGTNGPSIVDTWLLLQLHPLITLGLKYVPSIMEDFLLHTFPLPFWLVKSDYQKLYDAFYQSASSILDEAEKFGINRDEACHNLVFLAGFNAYGGMKTTFPALIKWVSAAGEDLHRRLASEIREAVKEAGGVTLAAMEKMKLTKSVVYETLRMEPPVPFQYGKAKEDMEIENHEWRFKIRKGEMIFGYQPLATKDPRIFEKAEEFVGDRFVGEEGEKLVKEYVYWSNGKEADDPTVENKQCPGKDLVVLLCRLMLIEFFLRYDTLQGEAAVRGLGSSFTLTSLTKHSQS